MTILRTFRLHCLTFDRANILVLSMLHHEFLEQIRPTVNLKVESDETELPKWVHRWMKDHVTCRTPINSTFFYTKHSFFFFSTRTSQEDVHVKSESKKRRSCVWCKKTYYLSVC